MYGAYVIMERALKIGLFMLLVAVVNVYADEQEIIFEGFRSSILYEVDSMTDKKIGIVWVDFGEIVVAIYGPDSCVIWPKNEKLNFAHDMTHYIRVGENAPYEMKELSKQKGILPVYKEDAGNVIRSLVQGNEVRVRYFDWPAREKHDVKIQNKNLGYVYNKASVVMGWDKLGTTDKLPPVELDVYVAKDRESKGYANVSVVGNKELSLSRNFEKYGGETTVKVGRNSTFGLKKSKWVCGTVDIHKLDNLIIRDERGKVVFKEKLPSDYVIGYDVTSTPVWAMGRKAAQKAWDCAPYGSIEVEGDKAARIILYGFRELWQWGVKNAGLPKLTQTQE